MEACLFWGIDIFLLESTTCKYRCDNPSSSEDTMVQKSHFPNNLKIWKREIRMFPFMHSNFE